MSDESHIVVDRPLRERFDTLYVKWQRLKKRRMSIREFIKELLDEAEAHNNFATS